MMVMTHKQLTQGVSGTALLHVLLTFPKYMTILHAYQI